MGQHMGASVRRAVGIDEGKALRLEPQGHSNGCSGHPEKFLHWDCAVSIPTGSGMHFCSRINTAVTYIEPKSPPDPPLQCCGSGMFIPDPTFSIPDPNCLHPGSASKNLSILAPKKPKKWFLSSRKYDPGCSSRIPNPDADFLLIPDPGSRGQKGTRSRIPDPQHCSSPCFFFFSWLDRSSQSKISYSTT